jgi:hypothetical protein
MIASYFWFFVKFALLGSILVYASLAVSAFTLYYLGIPISKIHHKVELFYTVLLYFIFAYINGFLGAYYYSLVTHYNIDHHIKQKWVLIIISFFFLGLWYRETRRELNRQLKNIADKMNPMEELRIRIHTGIFNKELLYHMVINCSLKTFFTSILGFAIFLVFPSVSAILYSSLPAMVAGWFD